VRYASFDRCLGVLRREWQEEDGFRHRCHFQASSGLWHLTLRNFHAWHGTQGYPGRFNRFAVDVWVGEPGLSHLEYGFALMPLLLHVGVTDTSRVKSMRSLFADSPCVQPVNCAMWDTGEVSDMEGMFYGADAATPDTGAWDTSLVTDMSFMFNGAKAATPETTWWDVGQVIQMQGMFIDAAQAKPETTWWDVSNVEKMNHMFVGACAAEPITTWWDVRNVTSMKGMFSGASKADPITTWWEPQRVLDMEDMFEGALTASPNVAFWDARNVKEGSARLLRSKPPLGLFRQTVAGERPPRPQQPVRPLPPWSSTLRRGLVSCRHLESETA